MNHRLKYVERMLYQNHITNSILSTFTPEEQAAKKLLYKESFYAFVKESWQLVDRSEFKETWHVKALCDHLQEVYNGNIKYLVINIPPRLGKSLIVTVLFPAWVWTLKPSSNIITVSYSEDLVKKHLIKNRDLIRSNWYQGIWGNDFFIRKDIDNKTVFANNHHGERRLTTLFGGSTGFGADILICDDPNKALEVESSTIRNQVNTVWIEAFSTRHVSEKTFARIVCQQRLNEQDLSGFVLSHPGSKEIVHLSLPMEFEETNRCITIPLFSTNGKKWFDPRTKEGELLCPELASQRYVDSRRTEMGEHSYAGQYQQRPAPIKGDIFHADWFNNWTEDYFPELRDGQIIQSWDTAITDSIHSSYSACTTWGIFDEFDSKGNIILLDMWVGKLSYPYLRTMVQRLSKNYHDTDIDRPRSGEAKPDIILIEKKATGDPLIADMRRAGVNPISFDPGKYGRKTFNPHDEDAKVRRAKFAASYVESGRVWLPAMPPAYSELIPPAQKLKLACLNFPTQASNDIVDSMSQAIMYMVERKLISHSDDPSFIPFPNLLA